MSRRSVREPEPIEIVLVALDAEPDRRHPDRPPPAGAGSLPGAAELVQRAVDRARGTPAPPLGPDRHQLSPWPELRVHRLVRLPLPAAEAALVAALRPLDDPSPAPSEPACARRPGPPVPILCHLARLHVRHGRRLGAAVDGLCLEGTLRVRRHGRPTPVAVTVEPWSHSTSDLSLQVRTTRRTVHLPRRYFDVAHRVMDDLWHRVEAIDTADVT